MGAPGAGVGLGEAGKGSWASERAVRGSRVFVCVCAAPRVPRGSGGSLPSGLGGAAGAGAVRCPGRLSRPKHRQPRGELPASPRASPRGELPAPPRASPPAAAPPCRGPARPCPGLGCWEAAVSRRLHWLRSPIPRPPHPGAGRAQSLAGSSPKPGGPSPGPRCGRGWCSPRPRTPRLGPLRVDVECE